MKTLYLFSSMIMCVFIELRCEYFTQLCRTCDERSPYFDITYVQSLIHCAAVCTHTTQCKSVTFVKDTRHCKLYSFHSSGCLGEPDDERITLQVNYSGENCSLTAFDFFYTGGYTPSIKTECGNSFLVPPLVFELRGSGASSILVQDSGARNHVLLMFTNLAYRYANFTMPGNEPSVKYIVLNGLDPDAWSRYWVMINKQKSGNMTVLVGKEEKIGCHVMYEKSDIPEFTIDDIRALQRNGNWSMWTFFDMD